MVFRAIRTPTISATKTRMTSTLMVSQPPGTVEPLATRRLRNSSIHSPIRSVSDAFG